jgi:hypothetical protein
VHAERLMLVEAQIPRELAPHERQRAGHAGARLLNFVDGMWRFELHPIDARHVFIGVEPLEAVLQPSVGGIAGVALGHNDAIGIELMLQVHGGAIPDQGLLQGHDFHPGILRAALALNGLIINTDARQARPNGLGNQPPHGHNAPMARIAIDYHGKAHALGDPAGDGQALGHGRHPDVRQARIGTNHTARPHKGHLRSGQFHEPGMRSRWGMHDREHAVRAIDELLQASRGLAVRHQVALLPWCRRGGAG